MLTGVPQSLASLFTVLLFYTMDFFLIRRHDRQRQASGSGRAWDFTLFIFLIVSILVFQPVLLPSISYQVDAAWGFIVQILGVFLILIALALHIWSRAHLGHYYAERVEVQPGHLVVETGPYRLVRHPVITSFFGIATGLLLINPALTTLAAILYTVWDFTNAASREEDLLKKTVPGYADYALRTPRFLPRLRKKR